MKRVTYSATAVGFSVALAILMLIGALMYRSTVQLVEGATSVEHTHAVQKALDGLSSALLNAESGRRGFVMAGQESELKRFRLALDVAKERQSAVRALTVDNPDQQGRLDAIEPLLAGRLALFEQSVETRRAEGFESPRQLEFSEQGKAIGAELRDLIRAMEDAEGALLARRQAESAANLRRTALTMILGVVASMALFVCSFAALRSETMHRRRTEAEIHRLNAELEQRVIDRTVALEAANATVRTLNADLERGVAERTTQLQETNGELEAFSYSVSHDLRAPLRHMDGFVKLLRTREGGQLDATSTRYLDIIATAAARMGRLIDDLLAFSRTGRAELRMQRVALDDLVRDARQEVAAAGDHRHIAWQVAPLPAVQGDPALLRLVWVNLLSNAIKYTAPRSEAQIEIGATPGENGEVVVFVRDNGVGFDGHYAHKLFGVFQRLHRDDEFEGTGIGLAIVRRIIDRHGGRVRAEGELNRGATVYLSLRAA